MDGVDGVSSLVTIVAVALSVNFCHVERKDIPRRSNIDNELHSSPAFAVTPVFVSYFTEVGLLQVRVRVR